MLQYGFFDSEITGYDDEGMPVFDRAESSDFLAMFISRIISDGVLAQPGDCFMVVASEGLELKVRPGFGIIRGRFAMDREEFDVYLQPPHKAYKRIDRIILRANYLERKCEIIVKTGTPDAKPVPPELERPAAGDYYELSLATVAIDAKKTVITQADITDTRYDSRVCGIVTQVIDHLDTSVFYEQLNSFYFEFVKKADSSYGDFIADMQKYLNDLAISGNSQLGIIVDTMKNFEEMSEKDFMDWFNSIKDTLESATNGEMLAELVRLMRNLYNMANQDDIDRILNETYVDIEDTDGIFEVATTGDIDAIIGGTYVEQTEDDDLLADINVGEIVDGAFREV